MAGGDGSEDQIDELYPSNESSDFDEVMYLRPRARWPQTRNQSSTVRLWSCLALIEEERGKNQAHHSCNGERDTSGSALCTNTGESDERNACDL